MRNKLILLALVALICIPMVVTAANDSVTTGPYKISFDMGMPLGTYTITQIEPKYSESLSGERSTSYMINIKTGLTDNAIITITENEKAIAVLGVDDISRMFPALTYSTLSNSLNARNIETATRTIDSVIGGIGSGDIYLAGISMKIYLAQYQPAFDPSHVIVTLMTSYPWDSGSRQLVNSIHVEKLGMMSQAYAGPTSGWAGPGKGAKTWAEGSNILKN